MQEIQGKHKHDDYLDTTLLQAMKWHRKCTYKKYNYTDRTDNKKMLVLPKSH